MRLNRLLLSLIFILSVNLYGQEEDSVSVEFDDLTTKDFVKMVGEITDKNILITDDLKGKINFISTKPIKKSSLIPLANSILANKGYTLVDQGDYYQVMKTNDAAGEGLEVDTKVGNAEVMKTVVFHLKYSNASVIRAKIKPLLHKNAKIISFKENNLVSITATPKTLRAVRNIIDAIEAEGDKKSIFIKLKYADIKDVYTNAVNMSRKLFPKGIESEQVDIFKDDASNSIILIGKSKNMNKMVKYVKRLDTKGDSTTQQMFVIPLKNSNVEDMQKIISQLVNQMNGMIPLAAKGAKKPTKAMVVSDLERNALVILADGNQIKNIRNTIRRLDVPKPQVYVKVKIVEINTDLASQIGLRYGFEMGKITSKGLFTLAGNAGADSLMISQNLLGFLNTETTQYDQNGNLVTTTEQAFSFDAGINEMFALGAKLDLMKQNGAAHILSEPSVLCINNKEASIYIGRTQSIMTQAQQSTQGQGNIINNYSREDIGITLKVKPRLSSNNTVSLEVKATIEDVLPNSGANVDRPTTTKRDVITNAIVNNGETIILGGLIKNSAGKSVTSVPILGDIPVLGELFKSRGNVVRKINVVIYLTPYIVRKSGDLRKLRSALVELEDIQNKYNEFVQKALESKKTKKWYDFGDDPSYRIKKDANNDLNLNHKTTYQHPASNRTHASSSDGIFTIGD